MKIKMLCVRRVPGTNRVLLKRAGITQRADDATRATVEAFVSARAELEISGRIGCCGLAVRDDEKLLTEARRVLAPLLKTSVVVIDGRELKRDDPDRETEDCMYTLGIEPAADVQAEDAFDVVRCSGLQEVAESKAEGAPKYLSATFASARDGRVASLEINTREAAGFAVGAEYAVTLEACECGCPKQPRKMIARRRKPIAEEAEVPA
ncbi:MAG: hypothetical protein AB7G51_08480 [Steroidobacteraceae bacterium]